MTNDHTTAPADVLVVDDEPDIRQMLTRMLRKDHYTVQEAPNAEEALRIMESAPVSAVLIDRHMPGHGGDWLVAQVLERFPAAAVVLASGEYVPPHISEQRGVVGYLAKPYSAENVRRAVADALVCHRVSSRRRA